MIKGRGEIYDRNYLFIYLIVEGRGIFDMRIVEKHLFSNSFSTRRLDKGSRQ